MSEYLYSIEDLKRYYKDCYAIVDGRVICVSDFLSIFPKKTQEETSYKLLYYTSDDLINYKTRTFKWKDIDFIIPKLGCISDIENKSVVYISREYKLSTSVKYRKGLSSDILKVFDPSAAERRILFNTKIIRDDSILYSFNKKDLKHIERLINNTDINNDPTEVIISLLNGEALSKAINNVYYCSINNKWNTLLLWRGRNIIGKYSRRDKAFKVETQSFNEELTKLCIPYI